MHTKLLIRKSKMKEFVNKKVLLRECRRLKPELAIGFIKFSDIVKELPAADVIPISVMRNLQKQIAHIKRNIKSDNSDYLTGYISALSVVEGIIDETIKN